MEDPGLTILCWKYPRGGETTCWSEGWSSGRGDEWRVLSNVVNLELFAQNAKAYCVGGFF